MPKKSPLALLLAMGGPKSRNGEGVTGQSEAEPDQSGGMGEVEVEVEEETEDVPRGTMDNCIPLPPGFQAPDGLSEGQGFDTTARVNIKEGKLYFESVGGMPLPKEGEEVEETEEVEMSETGKSMMSQRADEKKAQSVFQSGGY